MSHDVLGGSVPPKREGNTGNLQSRRACFNLVDLDIKGQRITSLFVCRIFAQNIASALEGWIAFEFVQSNRS